MKNIRYSIMSTVILSLKKKVRSAGILFLSIFLLVSCSEKTIVTFSGVGEREVVAYAMSEITYFLNNDILSEAEKEGILKIDFTFVVDNELPEAAFNVESERNGRELVVILKGASSSDI